MNAKLLEGPRGQEFLARTPMRRFGRVEELVGAAVFLASDAAGFVTGQLIVVDGGYAGEWGQSVKPLQVISESDNVATALEALEAGREVAAGSGSVTVREAIPARTQGGDPGDRVGGPGGEVRQPHRRRVRGHSGRRSRPHAQRVEHARAWRSRPRRDAAQGELRLAEPPDRLADPTLIGVGGTGGGETSGAARRSEPMNEPGFWGYRRRRRAGRRAQSRARRATVICSSVVAERVAAAIAPVGAALPHTAGCGQLGPDMRVTHDTLAAYCDHPNVGAVLVVALGCEQVDRAASGRRRPPRRQAVRGDRDSERRRHRPTTAKAIEIARAFADTLRSAPREWCDASSLILCVKCGGSDYTSGLASNPALGRVTDRLDRRRRVGASSARLRRSWAPSTCWPRAPPTRHRRASPQGHRPGRDPKRWHSASTSAARSPLPATSAAG